MITRRNFLKAGAAVAALSVVPKGDKTKCDKLSYSA